MSEKKYSSLKDFYPFYLSQHQATGCRVLHFIGTLISLGILIYGIGSSQFILLLLCPLVGYLFAWIGHFFIEKNRPATFEYPVYSLLSDFILFKDFVLGIRKFKVDEKEKALTKGL